MRRSWTLLVSLQLVHDAPHTIRSAAGQLVAITHANVVAVPDGIAQQSVAVAHAAAHRNSSRMSAMR